MRTMYDAIGQSSSQIPSDAETVGWYPDGHFSWTPGEIGRFLGRIPTVAIATVSEDYERCSVADRETGALTPAQCRKFIVDRNGFRPGTATTYCDVANLTSTLKAGSGLTWWLWIAWWLGRPPTQEEIDGMRHRLPAGVTLAAWQYDNAGGYDLSLVVDDEWHARVSN